MKLNVLISVGLFVATTGVANAQLPELKTAQQTIDSLLKNKPFDYTTYVQTIERSRESVVRLIAADSLRTADDYYVASVLADDPSGFFEARRVQHELALVALVLGHPEAIKRVALTWDGLNWSFGRGQRLGSYKRDNVPVNMDPAPAPEIVRNVFNDVAAARKRADAASNNLELEQIRNADQADREGDITPEMQLRMQKNDPPRRDRVLEMIKAGTPVTGRDFHNASLVLQHGNGFEAYRLAHELAVAAVALGDTTATWLLSRTYDRMLLHLGHRQRMNTQSGGPRGALLPVDSTAVNARIRATLGSK
ncbi:MAG TPA: hypothetical protein VM100_01940 [Longimicrobiales bacterium]|nr:hypothetical protein [Longimicrobiales bacterium]